LDRFTLYVSNLLASSADSATEIVFGHKSAIAFASQITKVENLPNPNDFGQLIRGLNVYGFKVVKPEALGWIHAKM
jgi:hypothetical protein